MSKFQEAGVAETLKSSQKDEYYLKHMRALLTEGIQGLFGIPHWLKWRVAYDACSDLAYFILTTVSGLQTLGEEYVHVVQVDSSLSKLPSNKRRFVSIILHVLGPVAILYCQKYLERRLQTCSPTESDYERSMKEQLLRLSRLIFWITSFISKLNLIAFYFSGSFYYIAKRLTGIKYALIRRWLIQEDARKLFMVLGFITAAQLCISVILDAKKFYDLARNGLHSEPNKCDVEHEDVTVRNQCALCTEERKHTTLTPCGHLFCWNCIMNWLQTKEECPLCREGFGPSRLIYLQNYK